MNRFGKHQGIAAVVLVLIIVGTAIAGAGCGSQAGAASGPVKLTEADNGKTVTVKVGDTVQVILPGNPTTGYSWSTSLSDKDAAVLQQQGDAGLRAGVHRSRASWVAAAPSPSPSRRRPPGR